MRRLILSLIPAVALLAPASASAFAHGDVPNLSTDKRAHEPPKEHASEAEHEGGKYHHTTNRESWWDNGGHEWHPIPHHASDSGSAGSSGGASRSHHTKGGVQHLAGGATVSDVPVKRHGRSHSSE